MRPGSNGAVRDAIAAAVTIFCWSCLSPHPARQPRVSFPSRPELCIVLPQQLSCLGGAHSRLRCRARWPRCIAFMKFTTQGYLHLSELSLTTDGSIMSVVFTFLFLNLYTFLQLSSCLIQLEKDAYLTIALPGNTVSLESLGEPSKKFWKIKYQGS